MTAIDGRQAALTPLELAGMPRAGVSVVEHGAIHVDEGALLGDGQGRGSARQAIHRPELMDGVIVEARDGYRSRSDLAQTGATTRSDRVILADRMDGSALDGEKGPLKLVIEGDLRPARPVRMVSAIRVVRLR